MGCLKLAVWVERSPLSALAVGILALCAFIFVEAHTSTPMTPLWVFRSRTFSGANLLTLLLYAALSGVLFFFLQFDSGARLLTHGSGDCACAFSCHYVPTLTLVW